jgi:hypothetical protein
MLVSVVTEHDVCCGVAADDRRMSRVRVEKIIRPLSTCCGASETVEDDARWNILEHRATSMSLERYGWRLLRYSGVHRSVERS